MKARPRWMRQVDEVFDLVAMAIRQERCEPQGATVEPFELGDRVKIVAMGIAGQIQSINHRLGGSVQYLIRYLDRQGCIREDWCTDVELEHTV